MDVVRGVYCDAREEIGRTFKGFENGGNLIGVFFVRLDFGSGDFLLEEGDVVTDNIITRGEQTLMNQIANLPGLAWKIL